MANSTLDHGAARKLMVASQLRPQGVTDARVLAAMAAVPREEFLGEGKQALAYGDRSVRLDDGSPMMPPAELGRLLDRLAPLPGERALVVGGGGGYAAAVLRYIGLDVETSDSGDGPANGPFDLILVEGAIEHFPETLARRLVPGGRVGAAIARDGVTRLSTGHGIANPAGAANSAEAKAVRFTSFAEAQVPILPGFSSAPAFVF